jgi:hypothetical protein
MTKATPSQPRTTPPRRLATLATATAIIAGSPGAAQTISISSIDAGVPNLGTVASAASGDTVFRIAPDDGSVTRLSGNGARTSGGTTRGRVVVTCTGDDSCPSASETVTITRFGSPTGRGRALENLTIAPGTNPPTLGTPSGTDTITFTVSGIPRDATRDFYVGADFGIADSGTSGPATAGFLVSVPAGSMDGAAQANVLRPLSLSKSFDLFFGTIIRPSSGTGSVTLNASDASLDVTGTGARALSTPGATLAQYTVTGEGGQSFSIDMNVETPFNMIGPGTLPVTLNTDADASPILVGPPGEEGNYSFRVGGSFPISHDTPSGVYSGSFVVTVLYN